MPITLIDGALTIVCHACWLPLRPEEKGGFPEEHIGACPDETGDLVDEVAQGDEAQADEVDPASIYGEWLRPYLAEPLDEVDEAGRPVDEVDEGPVFDCE